MLERKPETWFEFAQRVDPTHGKVFFDIFGNTWVYRDSSPDFYQIQSGTRISLKSTHASFLLCQLLDPELVQKTKQVELFCWVENDSDTDGVPDNLCEYYGQKRRYDDCQKVLKNGKHKSKIITVEAD